jgi:serine/threonine-protein kinase
MLAEGTTLGGFRIEGVLGQGGMTAVYEATQLSLSRRVALKVLSPALGGDTEFRTRFQREALLQARLEHDHVVAVYEAGEADALLYIAMRLIRGPNLKQLIRSRELGDERSLRLLTQVAGALDAAHESGLIHRDVKPQNILIGGGDHAYLADFGLTKAPEHVALTATGRFMGTLDYTSPEQAKGEAATAASDVYAFAAVVYECLTGAVPFPSSSEAAALFAHVNEPPPIASDLRADLPERVDDALTRGLAKQAAERQPTAAGLMREVRDGLHTGDRGTADTIDAEPRPTQSGQQPTERLGRRPGRRLVGVLAVLVVAAGTATLILLVGGGDAGDGAGESAAVLGSQLLEEAELGSELPGGDPVKQETCFGGGDADPCTLAQRRVAGREPAAPFDGVVTRWRVRHAKGGITLRVLNTTDRRPTLVRSSATKTPSGSGVNTFDTCLAIAEGDLIGMSVAPGGGFGAVLTSPAALYRWESERPTQDVPLGSIGDVELLLNADVERPGACEPGA